LLLKQLVSIKTRRIQWLGNSGNFVNGEIISIERKLNFFSSNKYFNNLIVMNNNKLIQSEI